MYIPPHFAAAGGVAEVAAFVDQVGAADLVTFDGERPVASLLPMIWERPHQAAGHHRADGQDTARERGGGHGRLLGHMALANPQWSTARPGVPALAIVHGPQAYVSPSWYESSREHGRAVPTWNYASVHFTGPVTFHRDEDWLRDVVTRLTERHEAGRPDRWWMHQAPEQYIAGQLRAIVGVEMAIEQVEAKDKLSQNRPPQDRAGVVDALRSGPDPGSRAIAELMAARAAADPQEPIH